jgi:aminoglycoside phosphotransferase (APT) family kinase protein
VTPEVDASLARELVAAQFPPWADLPLASIEPQGWDNRTFRLGDHLSVRLPSAAIYAAQVQKEHVWLPLLAPQLPLSIPEPLAMGVPGCGYPWRWSVYRWLDGETASTDSVADLDDLAVRLAEFLVALRHADAAGAPSAGEQSFFRGMPLPVFDDQTRRAISRLSGRIDVATVTAMWEIALESEWKDAPVWFHGDISAGNLLVADSRLHAVIDFGVCGVGDPACDLAVAWSLLTLQSRTAFRETLGVDADTWARGRGWALWKALITLAGSPTNAVEVAQAPRTLDEITRDAAQDA